VLWPFVQVWLVRSMGSAAIASFLANTHHAPWLRAAVLQDGDATAIRYVHSLQCGSAAREVQRSEKGGDAVEGESPAQTRQRDTAAR